METKIAALMRERGVTQVEMAKLLGISQASIYAYTVGKSEPSLEKLIKLADFFNVSLDYLVGRQDKNAIQNESLTEAQRNAMHEIKTLDDDKIPLLLGYIQRLKEEHLNDIVEKILREFKGNKN